MLLDDVWKWLTELLGATRYWKFIQPVIALGMLYLGVLVAVYHYVEWRYHYAPTPDVFLRSYLFQQVTITFVALVAAFWIALRPPEGIVEGQPAALLNWLQRNLALVLRRAALMLLVLVPAVVLFRVLGPQTRPHDVAVQFTESETNFDRKALTYLVYELNSVQRGWYFEVAGVPFKFESARYEASPVCRGPPPLTCALKDFAQIGGESNQSFALIATSADLAPNLFYAHTYGTTRSVVTDKDWDGPAQSVYQYLLYELITQGIVIHLEAYCGGLKPRESERTGQTRGEILEFAAEASAVRAAVLAARLSPAVEERLFNCLGPEYTHNVLELLRLEWLRAERVRRNLKTFYGVDISAL